MIPAMVRFLTDVLRRGLRWVPGRVLCEALMTAALHALMTRLMRAMMEWAVRIASSAAMSEVLTPAMREAMAEALTGALKSAMRGALGGALSAAFEVLPVLLGTQSQSPGRDWVMSRAGTHAGCGAERRELRSRNPQRLRLTPNLDGAENFL
jgi:hypothetical protein